MKQGMLLLAACVLTLPQAASAQTFTYPPTEKVDVVDDYHGTRVADPYRWLEDTNAENTAAWVAAQNALTFAYLAQITEREMLRARLTELWNYERYSTPFREGSHYFYSKNDGLQNQSVLYVQQSLDADPRVLLDPNKLSADGTVALSTLAISDDARYLGYGTAASGSDWVEFRVRDIASGSDLEDHIRWVKFSGMSWTKDGRGFFYSRYPEPTDDKMLAANRDQMLYYHRMGTPQEEDVRILYDAATPEWFYGADVTDDGRYALIYISESSDNKNRIYFMDLGDPAQPNLSAPVQKLFDTPDAGHFVIGNDGPVLYVVTDKDAPRSRLIAVDTRNPAPENWRTIIPEQTEVLQSVDIIGGKMVALYLKDAHSQVRFFEMDGTPAGELALPTLGSVSGISGRRQDNDFFYGFSSFLYPFTVFRYDMATGKSTVFRAPAVDFDPEDFETNQVFYKSKDGTRVPMFITHKRGLKLNGQNPTYLYGYGGFNVSMTPGFSVSNVVWLEQGGVYAMPNLRGGGEYGEEWHQQGMKEQKQNVFDDFIAAAEYLIQEGYTSPSKLAIGGGSNGGLLVGAAMTQRPELFGVALPAVGVMDMLRFHKFTIGWAWTTDYGSSDDAEAFKYLYAYSPLHNVEPGTCYPATMVTTADHDDRVVPGHSFKFAAALQAAQGCDRPALIRIETKAGHGAGKPTSKIIEEVADKWAFALHNMR